MRKSDEGQIRLALTDLSTFVACNHATYLFWKLATGTHTVEPVRDPDADVLAELGKRHEQRYVERLRGKGLAVVEVGGSPDQGGRLHATIRAMRAGPDAIVLAPVADGSWRGVVGVLLKVPGESGLGDFHYEVQDTKLSANTKGGAILQLSLYCAWVGKIQERMPDAFQVVTPAREDEGGFRIESYRVSDFSAYTRRILSRFETFLDALAKGAESTDPEPVEMCQICPWWRSCDTLWHDEDRLNMVPGLGRGHGNELEKRGIDTVVELAVLRDPLSLRPAHGSPEAYLSSAHQRACR